MTSIIRHDRVLAISGHFKGQRGYVCRVEGELVNVVFGKNPFGIWVDLADLKRTKRYSNQLIRSFA